MWYCIPFLISFKEVMETSTRGIRQESQRGTQDLLIRLTCNTDDYKQSTLLQLSTKEQQEEINTKSEYLLSLKAILTSLFCYLTYPPGKFYVRVCFGKICIWLMFMCIPGVGNRQGGGRGGGNLNLVTFPLRFCDDLACK